MHPSQVATFLARARLDIAINNKKGRSSQRKDVYLLYSWY